MCTYYGTICQGGIGGQAFLIVVIGENILTGEPAGRP